MLFRSWRATCMTKWAVWKNPANTNSLAMSAGKEQGFIHMKSEVTSSATGVSGETGLEPPSRRGTLMTGVAGHALTVAGLLLAALLVHSILRDQPTPLVVALGKPKAVILAATMCLAGGAAVRAWRRRGARAPARRAPWPWRSAWHRH